MKPCSGSSDRTSSPKMRADRRYRPSLGGGLTRRGGRILLWASLLCAAALFVLGLFAGAVKLDALQVLQWLTGGETDSQAHAILLHVRLPRSLAALFCGGTLALSGLLLQSALHNPLASAGTIGVNSGAGLFVLLATLFFPGVFMAKPIFAFAGAMFAAFLVFGLSKTINASKSAIIMMGVAVGSLLSAGSDAVVTFRPDSVMDKTAFFIGGFAHSSLGPVLTVLPFAMAGLVGAVLLSPRMNVLSLGDEVAASLGLGVNQCRSLVIICAALLAASAVCVGGLLGFVGLIVPHAARFCLGHDHRQLIPFTALLGGSLVTACDILARLVFAPFEFPVGILLSLLGAPFFLVLILRR